MIMKVLSSSSHGNCYLLQTDHECLILELGVMMDTLKKGLDYDLSKVVGALVTHEHKDHAKSISGAMYHGINVYATLGTFGDKRFERHAKVIKPFEPFMVGYFKVMAFGTQHDAAEPVGFLIEHPEMGKMVFATDTYYIKYKFKNLKHIAIEANYSQTTIDYLQKMGDSGINKTLVDRLLSSHMSIDNTLKFLQANDLSNVKTILLLHLSDRNSDAEEFKTIIHEATGLMPVVADSGLVLGLHRYPF